MTKNGLVLGAMAATTLMVLGQVRASVVIATSQGENEAELAQTYSSTDLLNGMIPVELPGDRGWHPANPASGNSMLPTGLPAFTDGVGAVTGLEGLLNDFPGAGQPAKRIQYTFAAPKVIDEVRVFTGNEGRDGRVFHTYTLEMSTDGGTSWLPPIYVQSHQSGTVNSAHWRNVLTQATDTDGPLASGVTDLRFQFFSVDNTQGEMRDPFDGANLYTEVDDGLTAAFVSPLVWEIDVLGSEVTPVPYTLDDVLRALGIAAGVTDATEADKSRLNVGGFSTEQIDLGDVQGIIRKVSGLDSNP
jgi:hypothetical protein